MAEPLLRVDALSKSFPVESGWLRRKRQTVRAVHEVSFSIQPGETLGLVGESGSGKSTVGKCIVGLIKPTSGEVFLSGQRIDEEPLHDPKAHRKAVQLVFQDPSSSLNPRRTVRQTLALPLRIFGAGASRRELDAKIRELLEMVELPWETASKMPKSLSGGQRQRVAVARALACDPKFIVLDEPTSALDVSVQAKIVRLLGDLRTRLQLSYLFITHDLSLVRSAAHRTAVMYLGQLCEVGPNEHLFSRPLHPYTRTLLAAIPVVSEAEEALRPSDVEVRGEIPSPLNIPPGCSFHTRCSEAMPICSVEEPVDIEYEPGHRVMCHLYPGG